MNEKNTLKNTPIAVIGLSSIFADASNIAEFWSNIITGKDSITEVPESRWRIDDYYDEDITAEDKTYCKVGGFLPDLDFNPLEFGLPPNILEVTDASQLLGLIAARDAFEDAGYGRSSAKFTKKLKEKTGVLLGVGGGQKLITPLMTRLQYPIWGKALRASGIAEEDIPPIVDRIKKAYVGWNENAFPGLLGNVVSGRISNRFDLGGINSVVDAACAASLSAIKMALSELVEGRCDMMLTGGVDTDNSPFMYMSFSKTPAFSKSGHIRPFSEEADGMLIGEGVGMLVLKRLEDAERDGDRIYAMITGVGASSDGRFKSLYAPRASGQAMAMNRAYEDAGYAPSTVGLIEAHGTGTVAGDPTEFTSMQMVFGANNQQRQHIALGSVKSQIGHTKAAAGAAGMVKAALSLYHNVLPPTINVEQPNSKFDISNSSIYINTEARPWIAKSYPRRAGVSAFGFGGINVHIALEEYRGIKPMDYRLHQPFKTILLQSDDPGQLLKLCRAELAYLEGPEGNTAFHKLIQASDAVIPLKNSARLGFVVKSVEECIELLKIALQQLQSDTSEWSHPKGIYYRPNGIDLNNRKVVALFAGQGSQYVGMGKELANAFPEVAQTFEKTDILFRQNGETALSEAIFPIPTFSREEKQKQENNLTQTQYAQPAIGALSMGQYKVLRRAGFQPHFTAGHSFGELTALWAAGVFDEETYLALAKTRGAAMAVSNPGADTGTMLAVRGSEETVRQAIAGMAGISIANVNSKEQVVLGGSTAAMESAQHQLGLQGLSVIPLKVSAAFHTDFVKHAQQPFSIGVESLKFNQPCIPVYSNTTASPYPEDVNQLKSVLKGQILNPVLFKDQIENIYQAGGRVFVEFGPKGVLTRLVKNILQDKDHTAIAINANPVKNSDMQFRNAVVQMRVWGLPLSNIDPFHRELHSLPPKTKLDVKISANNYVSAATQKAYSDSLSNGFHISTGQTKVIEKIIEVEKVVEVPVEVSANYKMENELDMNKEVVQLLKSALDLFSSTQAKSLEIFERMMNDQKEQAQQILQLLSGQMQAEKASYKGSNGQHHIESEQATKVFIARPDPHAMAKGNGSEPIPAPKPEPAAVKASVPAIEAVLPNVELEKILLEVVSEKTGYPAEMLELNMDMEADLGIDSIKRVEIFGALTSQYPEMAGINPNELTELRTLKEIVDYVDSQSGPKNEAMPTELPVKKVTEIKASTIPAVQNPAGIPVDNSKLEKILLEVVSEKTGYPAEMLELNMDMEADLGIDSIKRVEIFGALTQQYPEMAGINPNELTELRTLEEIVGYVVNSGNGSAPKKPVVDQPVAVQEIPASTTNLESDPETRRLEKILLEVVSEKTGYPSEMLELSMDMEADLGIDSIKRVEIFGALTQQYPEMAGINPNELTELRTLGEIVSYVDEMSKKKV